MIGIYKITNPKGEVYIGQSVNIEKRRNQYKKGYCKNQPGILDSIKKYGFDNHVFDVLLECSVEHLNDKERYFQDYFKSVELGLNMRATSSINKSGYLSKKIKDKISLKKKGIRFSESHKQCIRNNAFRRNLILDTRNGIFHDSAKIAHKTYMGSYYTFIARLNGRRKNDTGFEIV